jgi:hypothetical protein
VAFPFLPYPKQTSFSIFISSFVSLNIASMIDNYRLPRKNASFRFVILHGHLWGGRFQMAVIAERQVAGGNGK